jgi:hypothetical protein
LKPRILFWSILFSATLFWLTSRAEWNLRAVTAPILRHALQWSEPTSVHSAGLTPEEQNNIDIYKTAQPATV